jgi:hypothetical protein
LAHGASVRAAFDVGQNVRCFIFRIFH